MKSLSGRDQGLLPESACCPHVEDSDSLSLDPVSRYTVQKKPVNKPREVELG